MSGCYGQRSYPYVVSLQDIEYQHPHGLSPIAALINGRWLRNRRNLLITGGTGRGKTWLTCALGDHACRQGFSVRYFRTSRLFEALLVARGDNTYSRLLRQLATTDLIILDDFGLDTLTHTQLNDFLEVMDERHGTRSTLVASQIPVKHWHEAMGDPTLADAILDRLVHNAHRLRLTGESMRKRVAIVERDETGQHEGVLYTPIERPADATPGDQPPPAIFPLRCSPDRAERARQNGAATAHIAS